MTKIKKIAKAINALCTSNSDVKVTIGGDTAFSTGGRINIPFGDFSDPKFMRMANGYIDHEIGHEAETEHHTMTIIKQKYQSLGGSILNALEDARMEALQGTKYPGAKINLENLWELAIAEELIIHPSKVSNIISVVFSYILSYSRQVVCGYVNNHSVDARKIMIKSLGQDFETSLSTLIEQVQKAKSSHCAMKIAFDICELLKVKQEEQKQQQEDQSDDENQNDDPDSDDSDNDDNSNPKPTDLKDEESEDDSNEDSDDNSQSNESSDDDPNEESEDADSNDSDNDSPDDTESNDGEDSSKSEDESNDESDNANNEDGDSESANDTDDSKDDPGASDDEAGDDSNEDSDDADGESNDESDSSDSEDSKQSKTGDNDDSNGDSAASDAQGNANTDSNDDADGESGDVCDSDAGDSASKNSDDDGEFNSQLNEPALKDGDQGDLGGNDAGGMSEMEQGDSDYHKEIAELLSTMAQEVEQDSDLSEFDIDLLSSTFTLGEEVKDWRGLSNKFARTLQRVIIDNSDSLKMGSSTGRKLLDRAIASIPAGKENVFEYKEEDEFPTSSVLLLVDASGSMNGRLMNEANKTALAFAKAFQRMSIDVEVDYYGVYDENRNKNTIYQAKRFGQRLKPENFRVRASGSTPTHDALFFGFTRMVNAESDNKIIIVITDGQPDKSGVLANISDMVVKAGVKLVPIGLGTKTVFGFKESVYAKDSEEVNQALKDAIKKKLF
jgi:uncharacterized protein YegL